MLQMTYYVIWYPGKSDLPNYGLAGTTGCKRKEKAFVKERNKAISHSSP